MSKTLALIIVLFCFGLLSRCHPNVAAQQIEIYGDLYIVSKYYGNILTQGIIQIDQKMVIATYGSKVLYYKVSDLDPINLREIKMLHNVMYFSTRTEAIQFAIRVLSQQRDLIKWQKPKEISSAEYKLIEEAIKYYKEK